MNTETLTQTSTLVNTNNHIKVGKKKLVRVALPIQRVHKAGQQGILLAAAGHSG